jgi:hypothetical protein
MAPNNRPGRRQFLLGISASAAATGLASAGVGSEKNETLPKQPPLPTIHLGQHSVTRLIAGWNPIGGYSYLGRNMDRHMREYFTVDRTVEFLLNCESEGINAHQFDPTQDMVEVLRTVRESGSKMKFICLHSGGSRHGSPKEVVERTSPIALAHHGGVTDKLFREGKATLVHDYVKQAHDLGVLAGVSAHNPDNIKRIADEGWENDFFMTCFYYVTRYNDHPEQYAEQKVVGKAFYAQDAKTMTNVARQVGKPCLGFKILAGGRAPMNRGGVKKAFSFAFENLKPTDAVIVGMYPRFSDEVQENANLTREFATAAPDLS